jgi:hypothetical protein
MVHSVPSPLHWWQLLFFGVHTAADVADSSHRLLKLPCPVLLVPAGHATWHAPPCRKCAFLHMVHSVPSPLHWWQLPALGTHNGGLMTFTLLLLLLAVVGVAVVVAVVEATVVVVGATAMVVDTTAVVKRTAVLAPPVAGLGITGQRPQLCGQSKAASAMAHIHRGAEAQSGTTFVNNARNAAS